MYIHKETNLKSCTVCTSSSRSLHRSMNKLNVLNTGALRGGQGHKTASPFLSCDSFPCNFIASSRSLCFAAIISDFSR